DGGSGAVRAGLIAQAHEESTAVPGTSAPLPLTVNANSADWPLAGSRWPPSESGPYRPVRGSLTRLSSYIPPKTSCRHVFPAGDGAKCRAPGSHGIGSPETTSVTHILASGRGSGWGLKISTARQNSITWERSLRSPLPSRVALIVPHLATVPGNQLLTESNGRSARPVR